jgi:hypothetical protein
MSSFSRCILCNGSTEISLKNTLNRSHETDSYHAAAHSAVPPRIPTTARTPPQALK